MARSRGSVQRLKDRAKVLAARVRILEEENSALRVMAEMVGAGVKGQSVSRRPRPRRPLDGMVDCLVGRVDFPLPRGWVVENNGVMAAYTVERHGQKYAEVKVVRMEEDNA